MQKPIDSQHLKIIYSLGGVTFV